MPETQAFEKIAPYLKDPLVLIGFFLFVSFLFLRSLVTKGIIPELAPTQGFSILKIILLYGFIIGLLLIGLGFGLKYRELSKGEQRNIVKMLSGELQGNIEVVVELKRNTETFWKQQMNISQFIRTKGIRDLPIMFPQSNLDLDSTIDDNVLAQNAFRQLVTTGLAKDKNETEKLTEFAKAVTKTIRTVAETNEDLRDSLHQKYQFSSIIWTANLPAYKKVGIIDISLFQRAYTQLNNIRNDYEVIAKATLDFQQSLLDYFRTNNVLSWDQLARVLSLERNSYDLMVEYSKNLLNTMTDLNDIHRKIENNIDSI